jgi:hypothetical protein
MFKTTFKLTITLALAVITATQVDAGAYSNAVLSGSPLFYWNFDEAGDLDPALDLVGAEAGDALLPEGNATRIASTSTTGGLFLGRAASFDGTQFSKFYSGALHGSTPPDAWALEMWIRPQGPDPGDRFDYVLEARGGGNNVPGILFDYGNNDRVEIFGGGGRTDAGGPALTANWQHLVIGYYGAANDRADFFLNGAPAGSVVFAGNIAWGTSQLAVGNSVPGAADFDHFEGQIDELAIYNLTGQSVSGITTKLSALATHYSVSQPGIPGDANKDGTVNELDFFLISNNLFTTQTPGNGGDLDLNAIVNFADYRLWRSVVPPELAAQYAVPEPAGAAIVIFGAWGLLQVRRGR